MVIDQVDISELLLRIPMGRIKAISMSKIKKIKVVIKKRSEKGLRAFLKGEKPHSKGVIFSRSLIDFSLVSSVAKMKTEVINKLVDTNKDNVNIRTLINK